MNMKTILAMCITSIAAAGCASAPETASAPSSAATTLSGDEIRQVLAGNTVEGKLTTGEYFKAYHTPEGKVSAVSETGGKSYTSKGTWYIENNTACAKWENPDWKGNCVTFSANGDTYRIAPLSRSAPGMNSAKVIAGNPHNL